MLEVKSVSFSSGKRVLVNSLNLSFSPGILHGVLGSNGSGKTTLLKVLSGIWKPSEGAVEWNRENLFRKSRQEISRIVSLVPQSPSIPFDFSAWEMVAMGCYARGARENTPLERERIELAFSRIEAEELKQRKVSQLSAGERQRLYMARALVAETPVLLLDEPTSNLDLKHASDIWKIAKSLADQGKTVIAAIHDLYAAKKYCDNLIILKQGHCLGHGAPKNLLTPTLIEKTYGVTSLHDELIFF